MALKETELRSAEKVDVFRMISSLATNVWTLLSVSLTFIVIDNRQLRIYVTDTLIFLSNCYLGKVSENCNI